MSTTTLEKPAPKTASLRDTLKGILPPLTMPLDRKGELVYSAVADQVNFALEKGVDGIVVGGSTGEGHTLGADEFTKVMRASHDAVGGRKAFVVGLIVNSTREAIERVRALKGLDIAALQITPVHYLFKPSPDATVAHFRTIYEETGIPILIYNVIPWNYLTVELMLRVTREVPGVVGMKQSSGDLKSVSDLIGSVSDKNVVLTGIDALLDPAFALGAHGAISALTAAVPSACVKLWDAVKSGDQHKALRIHNSLTASGTSSRTTTGRPARNTSSTGKASTCSSRANPWTRSAQHRRGHRRRARRYRPVRPTAIVAAKGERAPAARAPRYRCDRHEPSRGIENLRTARPPMHR